MLTYDYALTFVTLGAKSQLNSFDTYRFGTLRLQHTVARLSLCRYQFDRLRSPPPPPPRHPGAVAPKCVPAPGLLHNRKCPGAGPINDDVPGAGHLHQHKVLTQSSGLKIKLSECLTNSRRLRTLCQTAYLLFAEIFAL